MVEIASCWKKIWGEEEEEEVVLFVVDVGEEEGVLDVIFVEWERLL